MVINIKADTHKKKKAHLDFSNLQRAIDSNPKKKSPKVNLTNLEQSFGTNVGALASLFTKEMNDNEYGNLVITSLPNIIKYCMATNMEEIQFIWNLFIDKKYLNTLISFINLGGPLQHIAYDINYVIPINHVLYNMYLSKKELTDDIIKLQKDLAVALNAMTVKTLAGVNLPLGAHSAGRIGMCIYSNLDTKIGIERLNLYMINNCVDSLQYNEKTIVDIYVSLFGTCLSKLFNTVMMDVYSPQDLYGLTKTQQDCYYLISLAILDILVQAPSNVIIDVLTMYTNYYQACTNKVNRFSLSTLSNDYKRITDIVYNLSLQNIYVP